MELKECIYTRRSIRKYKPDSIPHEVLEELMEGAAMAPSGVNLQPWYFVVIETPKEVKKYTELMKNSAENFRKTLELRFPNRPDVVDDTIAFMSTMGGAPVIVLAFFKKESFNELGKASPALQSVSAAIENLLLLAWDKGIGSCWMTGALMWSLNANMHPRTESSLRRLHWGILRRSPLLRPERENASNLYNGPHTGGRKSNCPDVSSRDIRVV